MSNYKGFELEKIFILDTEKSFNIAEKFKLKLENKGFKVITKPYALNGVRITGVLKWKEHYVYSVEKRLLVRIKKSYNHI